VPTPREVRLDGGRVPVSHHRREFDILSNRYLKDHEKRTEQDYQLVKDECQIKYWRTHNYHMIEGVYYDKDKEAKYREQMREVQKVSRSAR
jgi:hypothetical protein